MKVKFLSDMGENKKGSTAEVDDARGKYWVQMGIVEDAGGSKKVDHSPKKKSAKKSTKK
jgi:hypothetical protein